MKKFTKALSLVLAVMMIMCTISALSFSASAAETSTQTATIYFAAPKGTSSANTWTNVSLYYGTTTSMTNMQKIALTKTGKVYTGSKGSLTTIESGDWDVYSAKLTASQISAIDSSKYVGFINQSNRKTGLKYSICKATTSGTYASTASSIASFSEKMFVINGCYDTANEIGSYTVKVVNGTGTTPTSTATIYFAAPRGTSIANAWRNAQLYYGSTTKVGKLSRIDMKRTGKVYAGNKGSLVTIVSDDWDVYTVTLNADQIKAIDSSSYVGFINTNNRKTGLKAPIVKATESGTLASTKSSIASYNGKMFVINGCYDTPNEITTYTAKVVSNNTGVAPAKPAVTFYFAAPKGTSTANNWSSASLYYGNSQTMSSNTKIAMTKTGETYAGDKGYLTTLVSGDWDIYSVTLNSEQINRADYAQYIGFVNAYSRKTGYLYWIQKATASGVYADAPLSIADFDGKMFVINGCYKRSDEISTYTVKAIDYTTSEKHKINLTSNVASATSCEYSSNNKQVTVTYTLDSSMLIENIQAVVNYDKSVLKLASTNSKKTISPVFYGKSGGGFEANLGLNNMIKFNATNPDGYDFAGGKTVFTAVFDIVGSGDTTVDFDLYILTGTEDYKSVKMVYRDDVYNDNFTVASKATV